MSRANQKPPSLKPLCCLWRGMMQRLAMEVWIIRTALHCSAEVTASKKRIVEGPGPNPPLEAGIEEDVTVRIW